MRKATVMLLCAALLALAVWAFGCGTKEDVGSKDTTTTTGSDWTSTENGADSLEPGPRYDPYAPTEGELVTPSDYDLGLQEGYEAGYWAGLADGMRGIYDERPVEYDDSNEYYAEGFLEGYQEGYDDGYSDGEEM